MLGAICMLPERRHCFVAGTRELTCSSVQRAGVRWLLRVVCDIAG